MNYQDFVCPKCTHHPLRREDDFLQCPACQTRYPIRGSVPLLFPSEELSVVVDGHTVTLHETRDVYDRAYCCDGLMGTCLDETYDRVTKGILLQFASLHSAMRLLDLGTGVG